MIPALEQAARDPTLRGRAFQVYYVLTLQLDTYQFRTIKVTAEARSLRIGRPQLSRALNLLIERGYIEAKLDQGDARRRVFRLVPSVSPEAHTPAA
jgi:DNA-binding MarR family transcriptional regulator